VPRTSRPDPIESENPPLRFALQYIDAQHPYLTARRVTPQTPRAFGLGLYTGKGLLRGRIVIPIHNATGELIAYAGRVIDGQEPKYRFPAGFRKSLALFNLHRAIATKARMVIVVEGFFDAIAVHQAGYPVIGLVGSTLSRHQADLLAAHFDPVLVMLDGDEAGRQGTAAITPLLGPRMPFDVIPLDDGAQGDQLGSEQLRSLIGPCVERQHRQTNGASERMCEPYPDGRRHLPSEDIALDD
jgi:DNA primase